jgi:hypothetical protein
MNDKCTRNLGVYILFREALYCSCFLMLPESCNTYLLLISSKVSCHVSFWLVWLDKVLFIRIDEEDLRLVDVQWIM